jgi:hypothetical protein
MLKRVATCCRPNSYLCLRDMRGRTFRGSKFINVSLIRANSVSAPADATLAVLDDAAFGAATDVTGVII